MRFAFLRSQNNETASIHIPRGGENNETLYDSESCSLWQWALTMVPGMMLNGLFQFKK
jgi:hypothetical protein